MKAAVTANYNSIGGGQGGRLFALNVDGVNLWPELSTDIMTCQWGAFWIPLTIFGWNSGSDLDMSRTTFARYNTISQAELTIDRIKDVEMDEALKKRYIAELEGIKGWVAFVLYDLYGPIPVAPLEVLKDPLDETILERPSKEWMVEYISTTLRKAANDLPVTYEEQDSGRITKGAALMVLLKLYLHEKDWKNLESTAREIMALNQYELLPDYASIFTKENQGNKEVIYAVPATMDYGNVWMTHTLSGNYKTDNPNIAKWGGYRMRWSFFDTFEPEDKRLEVIAYDYVGTDGVRYNKSNPGSYLEKGPMAIKYGEDLDQIGNQSSIDAIVYRYSDVLLSLAEAIANGASPNQESIDLINQVRNRAGLSDLKLVDYMNIDSFNEMILLERGHELFAEGGRRQDQVRHGTYIEFGKTIVGSQAAEHKVLFPIPQEFIDEGQGKILQNPGY
ncbi:RagB/SusD family nutrient uptake outer membrane protein [Zobellia galactanivorans]|uniref:RagB/SusD family nutrient uptake outer membrane protein n=1 Tax=Zobellia TaxID=112040 RepID=UPI0026E29420|nr:MULTISPECIES: RagB/SusD family nutrient uptake outer membrane protein [Zobellia]MDO6518103.1 RagB/SusD family nutrient uptake outer membrane protein [Zobellia uliginosa]MDO6807677.1 RagB/SusD family nutrient uptake outer membrane protein [Zobellia galactanivorans]